MHRIVLIVSLVLAGMVGVLAVAPRMIAWDRHRDGVVGWVAAATDQRVTVDGEIDLHLLPRPTLRLADATVTSTPDALVGIEMKVDRIELRLAPLPLLRGQLAVEEVRLVRPEVRLDALPIGVPAIAGLPGLGALLPLVADGPRRLSIVDGHAAVGDPVVDGSALRSINVELSARSPGGPFDVTGWLNAADQRLEIDARFGRVGEGGGSSLQLELVAAPLEAEPVTVTFRGLAWWGEASPRIRGEVSAIGADLRVGLAMINRMPARHLPAALQAIDSSFELHARLELDMRQARLDDLRLRVAETEARGRMVATMAVPPDVDLTLEVPRVVLPEQPSELGFGALPAALLASPMTGRIDLLVGALDVGGERVSRLRAGLVLVGPGQVTVEELRALLPGRATLGFEGRLTENDAGMAIDGTLSLATDHLPDVLAWLGARPQVQPGRLRTLSLATALSVDGDGLRLSDLDLRVDASRVSGSIGARWVERRQVAAVLAVDRLNLDAYGGPSRMADWVRPALGRIDLALEAEVDRLIWRGLRFEEVRAQGRSLEARFSLDELSFRSSESAGLVSGVVDLSAGEFDLAIEATSERPASLLRRLGIEYTPPVLSRVTPVTLEGRARGQGEDLVLDLELRHRQSTLRIEGEASWSERGSGYHLEVSGAHPDHVAFLEDLGMPLATAEPVASAPIDVQGTIRRAPGEALTVAGTARLGPMSVTGRAAWQSVDERPRLEIRLSAGDVRAELLETMIALAGWRRGIGALTSFESGSWPSTELDLWRLDRLDAVVDLSAKGGLAGAGVELAAHAEAGRLMLDRLVARPFDGRLELEAMLDVRRPLPFLAVALTLDQIESARLAEWLGLEPAVEGRGHLRMEATSAGRSVADLVRGLIGTVQLSVEDGRVLGLDLGDDGVGAGSPPPADAGSLPFSRLGGELELHRGIARADDIAVEMDEGEGRIEGLVDLLSWAGDLQLTWPTTDGREASLVVVGPLARPQVLWRRPAGEGAPGAPERVP